MLNQPIITCHGRFKAGQQKLVTNGVIAPVSRVKPELPILKAIYSSNYNDRLHLAASAFFL